MSKFFTPETALVATIALGLVVIVAALLIIYRITVADLRAASERRSRRWSGL